MNLLSWQHKKARIEKIYQKNIWNHTKYDLFLSSDASFIQIAKILKTEYKKALETEVSRAYFTSVNYTGLSPCISQMLRIRSLTGCALWKSKKLRGRMQAQRPDKQTVHSRFASQILRARYTFRSIKKEAFTHAQSLFLLYFISLFIWTIRWFL